MLLCISGPTASWLRGKTEIRAELVKLIVSGALQHHIRNGSFVEGPFRILYDPTHTIVLVNNIDYSSGLQDEGIGIIDLNTETGLCSNKPLLHSTLERSLFIISQRLRNLIFESSYYHQGPFANGGHKILAGRGADARDFSLGYYEEQLAIGKAAIKCIAISGPIRDWEKAAEIASTFKPKLLDVAEHVALLLQGKSPSKLLLPKTTFSELRGSITPPERESYAASLTTRAEPLQISPDLVYTTLDWTYDQWIAEDSPLSPDQRRILHSDALLKHPLRIIGPAGSGKTLLMQLMTVRRLIEDETQSVRVLYVTHNDAMEVSVRERFSSLVPNNRFYPTQLAITTLSRLTTEILGLDQLALINSDASDAKLDQREMIKTAFQKSCQLNNQLVKTSVVLSTILADVDTLIDFVRADVSVAIKGNRKENDPLGYIGAERPLGKLHGLLTPDERVVIFDTFKFYQDELDQNDVFDSDDIAISYLARVSTPLWHRRRKSLGFDFIFVDEAQLFVENEQRLFPLLSKVSGANAPIALALDEAQQFYGEPKTGYAILGLQDVTRETLTSNHRMSDQIADLTFYVISQSVDLFSLDFPSFDNYRERRALPAQDKPPMLEYRKPDVNSIARTVVNRVRALRKDGMRQIGIVCHSDAYWPGLVDTLTKELSDLDLSLLTDRGFRLNRDHAFAVLTKPTVIGGTEFDAVLCVGLEKGLTPKAVPNDPSLESALEQQALRDIYLAFSRARHQIVVILNNNSEPTPVLQSALTMGLILAQA